MNDLAEADDLEAMEPEAQAEQPETPEAGAPEDEADGGDLIVTIGEEAPPPEEDETAAAPEWVRNLRKEHREAKRRIKELESKLQAPAAEKPTEAGPRPTLQDCDYDEERHTDAVLQWAERKRKADDEAAAKRAEQEAQDKAWQDRVQSYQGAKASLKARDFDDAEEAVKETLSMTQQGIILQGAINPALLVYALGKNPAKVKELAAIKDPVQFAFAISKLEDKVKATTRKPASNPEPSLTGNSRPGGVADDRLNKLREAAERSGDWSDYFAAKRKSQKP
jgi:hypothetical protein